jgi:hypothetical protein
MKKKNIILSLAMALMIGVGATTYAYASTAPEETNEGKGLNCSFNGGNGVHLRGYDILVNLLNSKGIPDAEIDSAKTNGQSLHDLANKKGISDESIKEYMVSERIKNIDALVESGELTAEEGESAKATITENSANCTGEGQSNGNKGSMNYGNGGQRRGCSTN